MRYWAIVAFVIGLVGSVGAFGAPSGDPSSTKEQSAEILSRVHDLNQMEIKAGKLAKARGTDVFVRRFGDHLINDHRAADANILKLAKAENLKLTKFQPKTDQDKQSMQQDVAVMKQLQSMSKGRDFDLHFAEAMEYGHEKAAAMLSEARDSMQNERVKNLLGDLLPNIWEHRQYAANLKVRLNQWNRVPASH